jgi:hypothetical protein
LAAAEKVAKYRHAQLSAVRLAGDLNAKMDNATLDELLDNIKSELTTLAPLVGWEVVTSPPQAGAEGGLTVGSRASGKTPFQGLEPGGPVLGLQRPLVRFSEDGLRVFALTHRPPPRAAGIELLAAEKFYSSRLARYG